MAVQPLLLNVDWLALSVRFVVKDFGTLDAGHFYVDMDGTNVWRKRRIIFNQYAEKVATVLYEPKSKIIDGRAALIEIANEWLYHGMSPTSIISMIDGWRHFVVMGLSRVDICVDFNPTDNQRSVIEGLSTGTMYVGGKRSGSSFWSQVKCALLADIYQGKKICHCQSWGHKTTQVKWKLYYKTKELADAFGGKMYAKPYILDCWQDAGLDRRDVWRLEVSLKNCNQLTFRGQPVTYDVVHRWPRELFMALYTERFGIRKNEGHADRTNDTYVEFLPVGNCSGVRCAKAKGTNQRNGRIKLLRHLLTSLEDEEVLLDAPTRAQVIGHIGELVCRDGLQNYFKGMTGYTLDAFRGITEQRAAELMSGYVPVERERPIEQFVRQQDEWRWSEERSRLLWRYNSHKTRFG